MTKKTGRKPRLTLALSKADDPSSGSTLRESSAAFVFAESTRAVTGRKSSRALPRGAAATLPVFLIGDNRLLRDGITAMLGEHGIEVTAASSAKEALAKLRRPQRRVVLVDSAIKDVDSLALVAAVRATSRDVCVVVMGLLPTSHDVGAFVRAGVSGFIMKDAPVEVFVGTIRAVAGGARVLPGMLNESLLLDVATRIQARGPDVVKAAVRMSKQEREVVALIADGSTNREIAAALGVPLHAVKSHVHSIMEKLALHTRLQVAAFARTKPAKPAPRVA